ncbi:hypothetical protein D3C86_1675340 [compost metagenome]
MPDQLITYKKIRRFLNLTKRFLGLVLAFENLLVDFHCEREQFVFYDGCESYEFNTESVKQFVVVIDFDVANLTLGFNRSVCSDDQMACDVVV